MTRWLDYLLHPCRFRPHSRSWHRGPTNAEGVTPKLCDRCQQPIGTLLSGEMIAEPLIQVVAGACVTKAQPVNQKRATVTPLTRRSER